MTDIPKLAADLRILANQHKPTPDTVTVPREVWEEVRRILQLVATRHRELDGFDKIDAEKALSCMMEG